MSTVTSKDGTKIAYDKQGSGPAVILVDGALCTRTSNSKSELMKLLAPHFAVYCYDRRGRGDSGDTQPYAVEREIEDIEALVEDADGTAYLYGHSSGAALTLEATLMLGSDKIKQLAMYEVPYNDDATARSGWSAYRRQLAHLLAEERRGDAVALFMGVVGLPGDQVEMMRHSPMWPPLEALAPTLAYDCSVISGTDGSIPVERAARVSVPTLVMHGTAGDAFMSATAQVLSQTIPHAQLRSLAGQRHDVSPEALAPVLIEFFGVSLV